MAHQYRCLKRLLFLLSIPMSMVFPLQAGKPLSRGMAASASEAIAPSQPTSLILVPDLTPLETSSLAPGAPKTGIITSTTVSPTQLTIPSLWWIADQIAQDPQYGNKFIQDWIAYAGDRNLPGRVDLVVNRQLWSMQDYLQRFTFINRFSAIARAYGYNIRVFDNQTNLVGAFTCDFRGINLAQLRTSSLLLSSPADASMLPAPSPPAPSPPAPTATYTRNPIADEIACRAYVDTDTKAGKLEILRPPPRDQLREPATEPELPAKPEPPIKSLE